MNQLIEQKRAKYALNNVNSTIQKNKDDQKKLKEYRSCATQFPIMIRQNGLGQACAFYLTKGNTHKELYDLLSNWLCTENPLYNKDDLMDGITQSDQSLYRLAQAEAQAFLQWAAKFARAYISVEEDMNNESSPV